jgi:hypothetical protein
MKPVFFEGEPYGHALVWKWQRRGLQWVCETHDGHTLKVKAQRRPRGPFRWYAETWLPTIVESTGRYYDTADQAQEECLRFLKKWRTTEPA